MSIQVNGAARFQRTTLLPSNLSAYCIELWAKTTATGTTFGAIAEILRDIQAGTQTIIGTKPNSTELAIYVGEGAVSNTAFFNPGLNTWFRLQLSQSGTNLTVRAMLLGATAWAATWTTSVAPTAVPNRISFGGANNGNEWWRGRIGNVVIWNAARSDAEGLAQAASNTPVTTTNLLSNHIMDGPDQATDLLADYGGSTGDFALAGSGSAYNADVPVAPGPQVSGGGELPIIMPIGASLVTSFNSAATLTTRTAIRANGAISGTLSASLEASSLFEAALTAAITANPSLTTSVQLAAALSASFGASAALETAGVIFLNTAPAEIALTITADLQARAQFEAFLVALIEATPPELGKPIPLEANGTISATLTAGFGGSPTGRLRAFARPERHLVYRVR